MTDSHSATFTSSKGLRLDAPTAGDIVTVRVKRRPKHEAAQPGPLALLVGVGHGGDEADNPQHYRMNTLWRVLAVNAGQAVVECVYGYGKNRREIWSVAHHEWFEASELLAALEKKDD